MFKESLLLASYNIIHAIGEKIETFSRTPAEKASAANLKTIAENEAREIGKAFRETLLPGLPEELSNFSKNLSLPAQDFFKRDLRNRLDVRNAGYTGFILAEHGLTPIDLARVSHVSGRDLRLRMHRQNLPHDTKINFITGNTQLRDDAIALTRQDIIRSVYGSALCPEMTVRKLTDWFIKVLPHKPYAVSGFKFEAGEKNPYFTELPRSRGMELPGLDFVWSSPKQK